MLDYYREDERIAYLTDYDQIKIVPLLHRNIINFIGMKTIDKYGGFLRRRDTLIALEIESNSLISWNITTGKILSEFKLEKPVVNEDYLIY